MHEIIFRSSSDTISVDGSTTEFILEWLIEECPSTFLPITCNELYRNTAEFQQSTEVIRKILSHSENIKLGICFFLPCPKKTDFEEGNRYTGSGFNLQIGCSADPIINFFVRDVLFSPL